MPQIISVHSYRGGTGKSNITANLAALFAAQNRRVGVVDTDIQSPGIHILFSLSDSDMHHSLNDYLWGKCHVKETAHDVTARLGPDIRGRIFLIPSSMKAGDIARVLREGYDVGVLRDGLQELIEALTLDVLMIDTHPGLNEETLLSIAISDALLIVLRPGPAGLPGHQRHGGSRPQTRRPALSADRQQSARGVRRRRREGARGEDLSVRGGRRAAPLR